MRTNLWIGLATLGAASLLEPAVWAQVAPPAPPRPPQARSAGTVVSSSSYLGIGGKDIDAEGAKALNLKEARGVEVTNVAENSPAAKAGFMKGDVVWEYNGQAVEGFTQLTRLIRETPAGRQARIVVWRNGAFQTLTPTLEARAGTFTMPDFHFPDITIPPIPPMDIPRFQALYQSPMLGIEGESLTRESQFAEFLGVKDGVLVKAVMKDSAAEKAGIKAGDVIVKVNDTAVNSTREITSALRAARANKTVTVTVVRNKREMPLTVTIEASTMGGTAVRAGLLLRPFVLEIATRPVRIHVDTAPMVMRLKLSGEHAVI